MNHFQGNTPQERYQNDVLNELRKMNQMLSQIVSGNAQATGTKTTGSRKPKG